MLSGRGKEAARAEERQSRGGGECGQAELGRDGARGLGRDSEGFEE